MKHSVLHFLWSGAIGGAPRAVYQLVREQSARDEWRVGIAFGRAQGTYAQMLRELGCEVIDLDMRSGADILSALRHVGRLREFDIHHFHALEVGQIAASIPCRSATRVYTHRHGAYLEPVSATKRLRRAIGGFALRRYIHAVSGNTQHATRFVVQRYRLQHLPATTTYNGIDFSLLQPTRGRQEVRAALELAENLIVVGSSGALKHWKRFELLIQLLRDIPTARVPVSYTHLTLPTN